MPRADNPWLPAIALLEKERDEIDTTIDVLTRYADSWQPDGHAPVPLPPAVKKAKKQTPHGSVPAPVADGSERCIDRLVALLKEGGEPMTIPDFVARTGLSMPTVATCLSHSENDGGPIKRSARGVYELRG